MDISPQDFSAKTVKRMFDLLYTGQSRKLNSIELDKVSNTWGKVETLE